MRLTVVTVAFLAILAVAAAGLAHPREAGAEPPPLVAEAVILESLPQEDQVMGEPVTMSVRLVTYRREAVVGAQIHFYVLTPLFGGRLMKIGEISTNGAGIASLVYLPTWVGPHKAIARFGGSDAYEPASTPLHFDAVGPAHVYHGHSFGIDAVRVWLPLVGIGLTLLVWASLGYVVLTTVSGVRAGATVQRSLLGRPVPQFGAAWTQPPASLKRGLIALIIVGTGLAIVAVMVLPRGGDDSLDQQVPDTTGGHPEPLADDWTVRLVQSVATLTMDATGQFEPESATLAPSLAIAKGQIFVLDRTKGRIMNVADDGTLSQYMAGGPPAGTEQPMPGGMVGGPSLRGAAAMAAHGDRLYVANTQEGSIVVVIPPGAVLAVLEPHVPEAENPLTPAGIAVTPSGDIWITDPINHRVLALNGEGEFGGLIGTGAASSGADGLDTPGGIGLDTSGNLYVVDQGNHRVKKYSPLGVLLQEIGADVLEGPRDVAVDELGRVFVTDLDRSAVVIFAPDGHQIGAIVHKDPGNATSDRWFQAPEAIRVHENTLYVLDRLAGLFVFDISGAQEGR